MGYHQVELSELDRFKTAILTYCNLYVYNVMPFVLCNSPGTIQRLMEKVLEKLVGFGVLIYLDMLLYAEESEELIERLRNVLKLLIAAGHKCKAQKCYLFDKKEFTTWKTWYIE